MTLRRNSLGFDFPPPTSSSSTATHRGSLGSGGGGSFLDDEEADCDSAFVDDDLESSWDQLRMRQFKEQISLVEEATGRAGSSSSGSSGSSSSSVLVRLMKRLINAVNWMFTNGSLDKYEKIILVLAVLLIADTLALSYLLASYPVYKDLLSRLGYQMVYNTTSYFFNASPLRDL